MKFIKNFLIIFIFFVVTVIGLTSCTSGPNIVITSGFKNNSETTANSVTITGKVADNITQKPTLNINGKDVSLDSNNEFSYTANLHSSVNAIVLVAKDEKGNTQRKVLSITKTTPAPPPVTPVNIGDNVILDEGSDFNNSVLLSTTTANCDEVSKLIVVGDKVGITEMIMNGQCFFVDKGTQALIIDGGFTLFQVRIMSGDYYGSSGWLPHEFCKKP